MSGNSATSPRVVVTFRGGPCEGTVVLGVGKGAIHSTAAMAYRRYCESPGSVVGGHVWDGMCQGEGPADYYTITEAQDVEGGVHLVCEYEGAKHSP